MKALRWYGKEDVRVEQIPEPEIINPRDALIKITSTCICGSDLHMYDGYIPMMQQGDILGHEFMGEVVAVGRDVQKISVGDRVVVPFTIACGNCFFCKSDLWSLCDNSNPNAHLAEAAWGHSPSGLFGYSHLTGGYAGGQAEYARVPFADVGLLKIPEGLRDDHVVFLTDIFPTGYMAAELCGIKPGQVVAVWGCGPVGQFAIRSALMLGADRVIAIDRIPERLHMARTGGAELINYEEQPVLETLRELTAGRGPDACIDAVGVEAHGAAAWDVYDKVKQAVRSETGRPIALREAIMACRKGGTVAIPGVYGGAVDKIPMGAVMNKALTLRSGQTHMHRYMRPLLERIERGEIDPSFVITHRMRLDQAPEAYRTFRDKKDGCVKVVLTP